MAKFAWSFVRVVVERRRDRLEILYQRLAPKRQIPPVRKVHEPLNASGPAVSLFLGEVEEVVRDGFRFVGRHTPEDYGACGGALEQFETPTPQHEPARLIGRSDFGAEGVQRWNE